MMRLRSGGKLPGRDFNDVVSSRNWHQRTLTKQINYFFHRPMHAALIPKVILFPPFSPQLVANITL